MIDLEAHLSELDHGRLADLVGDNRIIELVDAVSRQRHDGLSRGRLILSVLGGPEKILEDVDKRAHLFLSFDEAQDAQLNDAIPGAAGNPRFSLTARRRPALYALFGLAPPVAEKIETVPAVSAVRVQYGLFSHQTNSLLKCVDHLESEDRCVMLHMPTGSGKTRTAMHLIARHLNGRRHGCVVWLVAGVELCVQAADEFRKAWEYLGERPLPVIALWGSAQGIDYESFVAACEGSGRQIMADDFEQEIWPLELDDAVIVASVDSVNPLINRWGPLDRLERQRRVSLVVFDEAHRAVAETYRIAIETLRGNGRLLGLSATPGRHHHEGDENEDEQLAQMFGNNKVTLQIEGFDSPVEGLIAQGYLSRLERESFEIVNDNLSAEEIDEIRNRLSTSFDLDTSQLRIIGLSATRNLQIVDRVERLVFDEGHRRIIVFAPSVESSDLLANLLVARDIGAHSVTSATPVASRQHAVKEYKGPDDAPQVLCNYGVLTTGFDAPATSAVVIARPTSSIVLLSQMAGRAIRGPRVGGNAMSKLVTVVDTSIPELVETVSQFHAFDESWSTKP